MGNLKNIGIMGGTFNPIHKGHLVLAEKAYEQFKLAQVLFMPSKKPPHKELKHIISDEHRVNMISIAIASNPHFALSTLELSREGTTYTVDTLEYLAMNEPDVNFYFIIGGDSLFQLETWRETAKILKLAKVVASSRYNLSNECILNQIHHLNSTYNSDIELLEIPTIDISSKHIRESIINCQPISNYVPELVEQYIYDHNLYRT